MHSLWSPARSLLVADRSTNASSRTPSLTRTLSLAPILADRCFK